VSETQVADQPSTPPLLVRLHDDVVVVAEVNTGLRAWALKGKDRLIASVIISPGAPTSLAIDDTAKSADRVNISIGFDDGRFAIYALAKQERKFVLQYSHAPSTNGAIHAIAYASPYLLTMTGEPLLSLYKIEANLNNIAGDVLGAPRLLSSLRSHSAYPPISLSIRASSAAIVASIAYAMPTWTMGWSVGLQEVRLTSTGTIVDSRMGSALTKPFTIPSIHQSSPNSSPLGPSSLASSNHDLGHQRMPPITKPTSLSYNHPYLLSAHADNTLTLYMVTSNTEELSIGAGSRLWGHTSSVSGAHVGDRGKAVSVSALGNELRVWELEGGLSSSASRKRARTGEASVQIRPESELVSRTSKLEGAVGLNVADAIRSELALRQDHGGTNVTKGWVAFDEEKVVLLREKMQGPQALVVYDFS